MNDGFQILRRRVPGLGAAEPSTASSAPPPPRRRSPCISRCKRPRRFEGFQLGVTYPLAKGGFRGSADGVACTSNGGGFVVANDRDDGTLVAPASERHRVDVPGSMIVA